MNYIQFNGKNSERIQQNTFYLYRQLGTLCITINLLAQTEVEEDQRLQINKKKLLNGKEKLWSRRKKEKKILCTDDDADGTWVYKNNNSFFYRFSSFPFRAEALFYLFCFAFEIALLFPLYIIAIQCFVVFLCSDIFFYFFLFCLRKFQVECYK